MANEKIRSWSKSEGKGRIVLGEVRFSYEHLTEPEKPFGNEPERKDANGNAIHNYSVVLLLPKADKASYEVLMGALKEAYETGVAENWHGAKPSMKAYKDGDGNTVETKANPVKDGDLKKGRDGNPDPNYAGCWYIKAHTSMPDGKKPIIFDLSRPRQNGKIAQIQDDADVQTEFYSGCYGLAQIALKPYPKPGSTMLKPGITAYLSSVAKYRDGEPFGGSGNDGSAYAGIEAPAPSYPADGGKKAEEGADPADDTDDLPF